MANDISPIKLFQVDQGRKLASEAVGGSFIGWQQASEIFSNASAAYKKAGRKIGADFWAGHDIGTMAESLLEGGKGPSSDLLKSPEYLKSMQRASLYRKVAAGAVVGATAGRLIMGSNLFTDTADGVVSGGIGFGTAGMMMHYGASTGSTGFKLGGWALAAYTGRNMMSPGDNWGPY